MVDRPGKLSNPTALARKGTLLASRDFVFTSESVSEGHPDKICDRISDAIVDTFLAAEPQARCSLDDGSGRKKVDGIPEIIPGDWGKVESCWLAQPLEARFARNGNRRHNSPVPLMAFARRQ